VIDKDGYIILKQHLLSKDVVAAGDKISPDFSKTRWVEIAFFHLNNRRGNAIE